MLALAREVGLLRLRLGPGSALEIAEEGPPVFSRVGADRALPPRSRDRRWRWRCSSPTAATSAARSSPRSRVLERDPLVAVESFEEVADAAVWSELEIPGSPFAIALDREGTVLAKGTFNNLAQLESVLATAERRRGERDLAAGVIGA